MDKLILEAPAVRTAAQTIDDGLKIAADAIPADPIFDAVEQAVRSAASFCWALRTYPTFDVTGLTRMREFEFRTQGLGSGILWKVPSLKLFMPHFGIVQYGIRSERFWFNGHGPVSTVIPLLYDSRLESLNLERIREATSINSYNVGWNMDVTAPQVPEAVARRVDRVASRFTKIAVAFEAQWAPAPAGDPLILGRILNRWFLIDSFDETKLEKYVSAEFTLPVREG